MRVNQVWATCVNAYNTTAGIQSMNHWNFMKIFIHFCISWTEAPYFFIRFLQVSETQKTVTTQDSCSILPFIFVTVLPWNILLLLNFIVYNPHQSTKVVVVSLLSYKEVPDALRAGQKVTPGWSWGKKTLNGQWNPAIVQVLRTVGQGTNSPVFSKMMRDLWNGWGGVGVMEWGMGCGDGRGGRSHSCIWIKVSLLWCSFNQWNNMQCNIFICEP